jgi:hypothetical protein
LFAGKTQIYISDIRKRLDFLVPVVVSANSESVTGAWNFLTSHNGAFYVAASKSGFGYPVLSLNVGSTRPKWSEISYWLNTKPSRPSFHRDGGNVKLLSDNHGRRSSVAGDKPKL